MEDVMNMMEENDEGNMEFPRDVMLEDCFSGAEEPLYGFVSNVTIPEEMLEPCLVGIECDENGNRIDNDNSDIANNRNISGVSQVYDMFSSVELRFISDLSQLYLWLISGLS